MIELQPATFEDFEREAERGNVVAVVRSVMADLQTPVGAYIRLAAQATHSFLLESVEGGERVARYSFLGFEPELIVRGRGDDTHVERADKTEETIKGQRATQFLREYFHDKRLARRTGLAPLAGGAVGFLGYEAARWFEPALSFDEESALLETDALFMIFRNVIVFDRVRQRIEITSVVFTDEAQRDRNRLREIYERAVHWTAEIDKKLALGVQANFAEALPSADENKAQNDNAADDYDSNFTKQAFTNAVENIRERILAGDCYQVVLSQRLTKRVGASPLQIYRALRATNPSPYMYFLKLGADAIVGASPEMLVRCRDQRLDYRPIAGTRRRGATETEDWMLGEELRADEKERAEHFMLVDLGRNDLGRVSDFGSVEVSELMTIERYSHVQHLVTHLRARLRDHLDRFDALAACFPAGTVSGAPKVSAMQVIKELEPERRGVYAGAVLYADYAGNLDSCIAIRTLVIRDGVASIQAGAGVVADSSPEREYEETLEKARALLNAIAMAERGF